MNILDRVQHGYADSNGVKIHYASLGNGPLILMVHGYPDFWYTWRHQMAALSDTYRCVAIDLRGYNLSDKPKGVEQYTLKTLNEDMLAVVRHLGHSTFILCGHDWGGAASWRFAMRYPEMLDKLIILNLPHPVGISRELANNPKQQQASEYARKLQQPDIHERMTPEKLTRWIMDAEVKATYVEAFEKSDFEAMANYYKANFAKEPYQAIESTPKIKVSTLQIHGLNDEALLPGSLNDTWLWMDADYTLATIPGVGHFVQQEAPDLVTNTIRAWLNRDK